MRTTSFFPLLFCLLANSLFSQSSINQTLSVNSTGAAADASAQLDVSATDKGMLVPRMTSTQRTAIATPATGLLMFDTTTGGFWFYNGTAWANLSVPKTLADADGNTKIQVEESSNEDVIRFDLGGTENMVLRKNINGVPRLELFNSLNNTFLGESAGASITLGNNNTAQGYQALATNTTGTDNTANGWQALSSTTTGEGNTASGRDALYFNSTGYSNTAFGRGALFWNATRSNLVAVGDSALYNNGLGATLAVHSTLNTALGSKALFANTTGFNNTAAGATALKNNATGQSNTAFGAEALRSNTNGNSNTAVGVSTLLTNITGFDNTAMGANALANNTTGSSNTATGRNALLTNTDGYSNTATGLNALIANSSGHSNTATGFQALNNNSSGNNNVAVGLQALSVNASGNNNTALGKSAFFSADNLVNTTALGFQAGGISNVDNRIEIGNTSVMWIGGQVTWSTYSDARIKTQVKENVPGLDFITRLRPVTYHLDIHKQNDLCFKGKKDIGEWEGMYDIEQKQMTGFIAQEVEAAAKATGYDFSGVEKGADEVGMYSVKYAEFVVPLVKAVQEQQTIIDAQSAENKALKTQVETLSAQLDKITAALQGAGIAIEK